MSAAELLEMLDVLRIRSDVTESGFRENSPGPPHGSTSQISSPVRSALGGQ